MRADAVELDVRRTLDGELVVHHDPGYTDGSGRSVVICQTDSAALAPHIPSLDQALDACEGLIVNVEIKNSPRDVDFDAERSIADQVVTTLLGRESGERFLVSSFDRLTVQRVRELAPGLETAQLIHTGDVDAHIAAAAADTHKAIHPWDGQVDQEFVDAAHRVGLEVNVWTVDDPARMAELAGYGVDGIVTNVPDVARRVIGA